MTQIASLKYFFAICMPCWLWLVLWRYVRRLPDVSWNATATQLIQEGSLSALKTEEGLPGPLKMIQEAALTRHQRQTPR
jgi:hypothetical protein